MVFDLSAIGFAQADDMQGIAAWRKYSGVKPVADVAENAVARFSVIPARVFDDHCRTPVKLRKQVEREIAAFDIGRVFGWIVGDLHWIIVPTLNWRGKVRRQLCTAECFHRVSGAREKTVSEAKNRTLEFSQRDDGAGGVTTIQLGQGLGLADLAVEASDCGQYLMLMCGETLVALVGATGSDVEAVEFADGGRYRVEDVMEMVKT
jgi:hypothetical protein